MDAHVRPHLLAQRADAREGEIHGVQGVDALKRACGRMARFAEKFKFPGIHGQRARVQGGGFGQVHLKNGVDVVERPRFQEIHFPPHGFFRRSADDGDASAERFFHTGKDQRGADRRGGDPVMPAGVGRLFLRAIAGQRVVFRQKRHLFAGGVPIFRPECRL